MSFGVGLGDVVLIIQGCIKIYNRIQEADDMIENVHDRLLEVLSYVRSVDRHLSSTYGPARNYPEANDIRAVVQKMKNEATSIEAIFERYREKERLSGPVGWGRQLVYIAGSSTRQLENLITTLERRADSLDRQVSLMNQVYQQKQVNNLNQPPSRDQKKPDVNILFVDSRNSGRSVVAHAYAQLVAEWTKRTGNEWRIAAIHSAGIDLKKEATLIDVRSQLKTEMVEGGKPPWPMAMSSLFDNPTFNYPYKTVIRDRITQRTSRGLGRTTFLNYDYIFCFTLNNLADMQRLKMMTKQKHGTALVPRGKAKIILLGEYGNAQNKTQIWDPKRDENGQQKKEDWNRCVANIKTSFKGWLTEELGWKQPPKGTPQGNS